MNTCSHCAALRSPIPAICDAADPLLRWARRSLALLQNPSRNLCYNHEAQSSEMVFLSAQKLSIRYSVEVA